VGIRLKGWQHFEGIQRIPLIVWIPPKYRPAGRNPGEPISEWAHLTDIYPTILETGGAEWDRSAVHGRSLWPVLRGETNDWRETVFVEFNGVNSLATSMASVRRGPLKYGCNCSNRDEFYDLSEDPNETRNLIDDPSRANEVREMRFLLDDWMEETGYPAMARKMLQNSRRVRR
jgi:arylsulfatase A-like enzyme